MTLTFPFEIGQAIWIHTRINDEWVTTQCEVEGYSIDKFGVEITVRLAGGDRETLTISSDDSICIDEDQVRAQFLFEDRAELMEYLKEEDLL